MNAIANWRYWTSVNLISNIGLSEISVKKWLFQSTTVSFPRDYKTNLVIGKNNTSMNPFWEMFLCLFSLAIISTLFVDELLIMVETDRVICKECW